MSFSADPPIQALHFILNLPATILIESDCNCFSENSIKCMFALPEIHKSITLDAKGYGNENL